MADVIIVGGGPAGVSGALYVARAGLKATIIENGPGALAKAHKIENYYGKVAPGNDLYADGLAQAMALGVEVIHDEVIGVDYFGKFAVQGAHKENLLQAPALLLATGVQQATPNIFGLKDLEGKGVSYCAVCDGFFFRGKKVAVIGNGAYAAHEAEYLSHLAAETTVLTNGLPTEIIDAAGLKAINTPVVAVKGNKHVDSIELQDGTELAVDGIFVALGSAGTNDIAKKLGLETNGRFLKVDTDGATAIPGLYAAGDCTGGLLQVAKAVYEGAMAGTAIVKYVRDLNKK